MMKITHKRKQAVNSRENIKLEVRIPGYSCDSSHLRRINVSI